MGLTLKMKIFHHIVGFYFLAQKGVLNSKNPFFLVAGPLRRGGGQGVVTKQKITFFQAKQKYTPYHIIL